jgi:hypothetical protein
MTDDELYEHAQHIWDAVEKGGWERAVAAARHLASQAVGESVGGAADPRRDDLRTAG